jgi:hypothetical protein
MPDTTRHDWAEESEALSLTLVRGMDDDAIIAQLGLTAEGPEPRTFAAAFEEIDIDDGCD